MFDRFNYPALVILDNELTASTGLGDIKMEAQRVALKETIRVTSSLSCHWNHRRKRPSCAETRTTMVW